MAKVTNVELTDDIDGSTEDVRTYHIGLANEWYEIDLSDDHSEEILDTLFHAARKVDTETVASIYTKSRRGRKANAEPAEKRDKATVAEARDWGLKNGFAVSKAGRLSRELWTAFDAR
jgi:hypothetical protein